MCEEEKYDKTRDNAHVLFTRFLKTTTNISLPNKQCESTQQMMRNSCARVPSEEKWLTRHRELSNNAKVL